jgi:hypothetical protein
VADKGEIMNATAQQSERPISFTQSSIRTVFILFTVFWWVGYPLIFVYVGLPILIAAVVFDCIILYWHWTLLQGHGARTTPGKAVGFGFIPFFNFYWWFVSYAGLAQDNNRYMDEAAITGPRMSYGLAIALCVVGIVSTFISWVPVINIIMAVPESIIGFLFVLQQKNCILAILQHRQAAQETV